MGQQQTGRPPFQAPNPFLTRLTQLSPKCLWQLSAGTTICHPPASWGQTVPQLLRRRTDVVLEVRGTLSHRSACHDGLLEILEPQVRLGEGK